MAIEPHYSETMPGEAPSSEPTGIASDAALILAALGRIETVVRGERAALARLRTSLADMAQAIARAKAVADSETAAAMLDEFEHRIDAMIEIAGGAHAAAATPEPAPIAQTPALESGQVPTVSDVVHRLGPSDAIAEDPPADTAADKGPTVAMLTAMVEALNASIPLREPEPEPPPVVENAAEEPPAESSAVLETTPESPIEPPPVLEAAAEPAPEPVDRPAATAIHETALLASLEQMWVRPSPPPDEGTAVIFAPKAEPAPAPEPPSPTETAASPEPEPLPTQALTPAEAEPPKAELAPMPVTESAPMPELESAAIPADDPAPTPTAEALSIPTADPTPIPAPELAALPVAEPPAMPEPTAVSAEAEFDPADFLFGPEPEPDPAAFLLDPVPPPRAAKAAILPRPDFVAPAEAPPTGEPPASDAAKTEEPTASSPASDGPQPASEAEPPGEPALHDPLRALKAMSANEKLALFS